MNIGNKLKLLRISKEYEPIIVSDKLGISIATYIRYERNISIPDLNMLEKISEVNGIKLEELIQDDKYIKVENENPTLLYLSQKLIEQFERRLNEKDEIIDIKTKNENSLLLEIKKLKEKLKNIK